jgi:hypothetical protein
VWRKIAEGMNNDAGVSQFPQEKPGHIPVPSPDQFQKIHLRVWEDEDLLVWKEAKSVTLTSAQHNVVDVVVGP